MEKHKNILILKDEVGKPKPATRDLPNGDHTYGKSVKKDEFNAASLLSSWNTA